MGTRILPGAGFGLPFPFPLAIGTDICQIARIARILRGPRGERFVRRILAPGEHRLLEVTSITTDVHLRRHLSQDETAKKMWWRRGNMERGFGLSSHLGAIDREIEEEAEAEEEENARTPRQQSTQATDIWLGIEAALRSQAKDGGGGGPLHIGGERWRVGSEVMGADEMASREMRRAWIPSSAGARRVEDATMQTLDGAPRRSDIYTAWKLSMEERASLVLRKASTFMAGRFAAKEAVIKAHSLRIGFHDIIIHREVTVSRQQRNPNDPPGRMFLKGAPIACVRTPDGRGQQHLVSISHDGDYATATALVYVPEVEEEEKAG